MYRTVDTLTPRPRHPPMCSQGLHAVLASVTCQQLSIKRGVTRFTANDHCFTKFRVLWVPHDGDETTLLVLVQIRHFLLISPHFKTNSLPPSIPPSFLPSRTPRSPRRRVSRSRCSFRRRRRITNGTWEACCPWLPEITYLPQAVLRRK